MPRRHLKGKPIQFFVSDELHEALGRAAASSNTTLSGYIRSHLPAIIEIDRKPMVPKNHQLAEAIALLAKARQDLKSIGNNINQSAKVLNSHAHYNSQLPTQLDVREDLTILAQAIDQLSRQMRSVGQDLLRG
jgi:hypothetical protein